LLLALLTSIIFLKIPSLASYRLFSMFFILSISLMQEMQWCKPCLHHWRNLLLIKHWY